MHLKTTLKLLVAVAALWLPAGSRADGPRIVNFVNFVRQNDFRDPHSVQSLFDASVRQVELMNRYDLPGTFLLQYDALIDERYQALFKTGAGRNFETGCWLEITEPHVKDAGLTWRGRYPWDPRADVDFTTGYTTEERRRLIDTYMAKFKEVFGRYPRSVGSWYIDAYSLGYLADKYHIVASCNCKDQMGTDGYTLWGGYWNQAYYPSRVNGYMPAQTRQGGIDVPVFRMLGSDPYYQYGNLPQKNGQGVFTLEPACKGGGDNRHWVDCYFDAIARQPCLAFNYTQTGQENAFTWRLMGKGLTMQVAVIDSLRRIGAVRVMTLEETGRWFKSQFKLTPATAVVAVKDSRGLGNEALWYDSRYYRTSITMDGKGRFRLRDLHLFDERAASAFHNAAGRTTHCEFYTLPMMDGLNWRADDTPAGMEIVAREADGTWRPQSFARHEASEKNSTTLRLQLTDRHGYNYVIDMAERSLAIRSNNPAPWVLRLTAPTKAPLPFKQVMAKRIEANSRGFDYHIDARRGSFAARTAVTGAVIDLLPQGGRLELGLSNGR